jgi:cytochrome P450
MTWICGCQDNADATALTCPTALQRVSAAATDIKSGAVAVRSRTHHQVINVLSSETAKQILQNKDLHNKPHKQSPLLKYSLTNANGNDWKRQRPAVQRALGGAKGARQAAVDAAVQCALNVTTAGTHDARDLCLTIAVAAVVCAVFGNEGMEVAGPLKAIFGSNLAAKRVGMGKETENLDHAVRNCVNCVTADDCLAVRLRHLEVDGVLVRDEVVGNCHSALLAGTQSICTTLTGALAHMAEHPQQQQEEESKRNSRAIVTEALRILPPVGSLPRCPVRGNNSEINSALRMSVEEGDMVNVDLLALAHASCNNESTWKFCPGRSQGSAAPWGLGDRHCPAGTLSVMCISAVLEALSASRLRWTLANDEDRVGPIGTSGWMASVCYQPTLVYPRPLLLCFTIASK